MRKLMLLMAMLAMALMAAAPAVAGEDDDDNGDINVGDVDINSQVCQNIIGDLNITQAQYAGDQTIIGDDNVQSIAQNQGVSVDIAQTCINAINSQVGVDVDDDNGVVDGDDDNGVVVDDEDDNGVVDDQYVDDIIIDKGDGVDKFTGVVIVDEDGDGVDDVTGKVIFFDKDDDGVDDVTGEVIVAEDAAAASGGILPDTGGASLIALGAGALLVAGGLLARRIVR